MYLNVNVLASNLWKWSELHEIKKCSAACLGRCGMGQGGSPKPLSGATLASHTDCAASHNVHSAVEKGTGAQWRNPMPLTPIVHSGASHRCTVEKSNEHFSQCAQWRKGTPLAPIVHSREKQRMPLTPRRNCCPTQQQMDNAVKLHCTPSTTWNQSSIGFVQTQEC